MSINNQDINKPTPSHNFSRQLAPFDWPTTEIKPSKEWFRIPWQDLWIYREMLFFLMWRDIKIRYKQTLLGASWAIIQPFFTMIVFSLFFGRLAQIPSDGVPYPIFSYTALLPWTFFANGLNQASNSLVSSVNLISKVYFPRLIIPVASIISGLLDFVIAFIMLIGMMLFYQIQLTPAIVWLPVFLLLAFITALGTGLWLSALNIQYRDIRYIVPFLVQVWLFITPIVYPSSLLTEPWRTVYGVNPMAGVVEGFRWALLGSSQPGSLLWVSVAMAILGLVTGLLYFGKMEDTFADVL